MAFVDANRVIPTKRTHVVCASAPATKTTHKKQLMRLVRKRKLLLARDLAEQGLPTIALRRLKAAKQDFEAWQTKQGAR